MAGVGKKKKNNIDDIINNLSIQIPPNEKKSTFIYNIIVNNTLDIVLYRYIPPSTEIVCNLSSLKINKTELRGKLEKIYNE